jgi:hypothetical protein
MLDYATAAQAALAQQQSGEPVAWVHEWAPGAPVIGKSLHWTPYTCHTEEQIIRTPLYAAPQQRGEPVATYGPCCNMLREGKVEPGAVHDGGCRERHGGELGPTQYLYAAPQRTLDRSYK